MDRRPRSIHTYLYGAALVVLSLIITGALPAQPVIEPTGESRIWIEGRSNVNQFDCHATRFEGRVQPLDDITDTENGSGSADTWRDRPIILTVSIPVQQLECGRSRMNRDLREALKADRYEEIRFRYQEARLVESDGESYELDVHGVLTVAGTSREINFPALGTLDSEGKIRVKGSNTIRMTDFEVEPPTALLGMVRAEDELTVHFDIHAIIKE